MTGPATRANVIPLRQHCWGCSVKFLRGTYRYKHYAWCTALMRAVTMPRPEQPHPKFAKPKPAPQKPKPAPQMMSQADWEKLFHGGSRGRT